MRRLSALALCLTLAVAPARAEEESSVGMGPTGPSGRGIAAAAVDGSGHLLLTYSDGSTWDVGRVVGPPGAAGQPGRDGAQGVPGPAGQTGPAGSNGKDGAAGTPGVNGKDGAAGQPGATGPAGAAGQNGTNGKDGATPTLAVGTVTTGAAGSSAAVTATQSGTASTLNFAIPQGQPGAQGGQGVKGDTGAAGPKGDPGAQGPAGATGAAGSSAPVYRSTGIVSGAKLWIGEALTIADGSWSASIAAAGCAGTPIVSADAIATGTAISLSAQAVVTSRSATAVAGYVNLPLTIAIGGLGIGRAPANVPVEIIAVCN